ncbi:hypothetical protein XYCOK13_24330 [Xylanibacillus composti]|uniref:HAD family hydrolase n=1 Tax=Xylanibacillus composti TaxID=1572762 RepID=A0A8J4H692_9BACL|nr:HAD-IA family hydrolase [Xylanibacillus composti]GIQ69609.1 hypothetical protein XYCOK13_24330 [Xylanibacillus composti]
MNRSVQGIIFDMDNTLLQSHIDFKAMREEIYAFLRAHELIPPLPSIEEHTSSTLIQTAIDTNNMTQALLQELWTIPAKHEYIGMRGAKLEPGVQALLEELAGQLRLTIVTNNSQAAARLALEENGIWSYFDWVVGREQMQQMKPSPSGFLEVLSRFPGLPVSAWVSVGDAWIDGIASAAAGIPFIAYRGDSDLLHKKGVRPLANMTHIRELKTYIQLDGNAAE